MIKNLLLSAITLTGLVFFTGCPVATDYTLSTPGTERIDSKLIGTWETKTTDAAVMKLKVDKADANTYTITILEKGEMFLLTESTFKAYFARFEGKTFFYLYDDSEKKYYLQHYAFEGGKLISSDVTLKVKGADGVTSNDEYRDEVRQSLKLADCLVGPVTYTKVK